MKWLEKPLSVDMVLVKYVHFLSWNLRSTDQVPLSCHFLLCFLTLLFFVLSVFLPYLPVHLRFFNNLLDPIALAEVRM